MPVKSTAIISAALIAVASALFANPVAAQSARTFVSGQGNDTGTCAITAPCRSFAYAITQTNSGGEIAVLNTAGYGTVLINKAISITNEEGVEAAITVASGDGITVDALNSATVTLSGLTLIGGLTGVNGITVTDVGTLNIKNCVITGFTDKAINFTAGGGGATFTLHVTDTLIIGNESDAMFMSPSGPAIYNIAIERTQSTANNGGFVIFGVFGSTIHATASDTTADDSGLGFSVANGTGTNTSIFTLVNSRAINNSAGVESSSAGAVMYLSGVTLSGNGTGYGASSGGIINTFGNNAITDTSNSGSLTSVALH